MVGSRETAKTKSVGLPRLTLPSCCSAAGWRPALFEEIIDHRPSTIDHRGGSRTPQPHPRGGA